jgi:hypothetical protein
MSFDLSRLIWWFPIAFIMHDFEELILFEPWLKKNANVIVNRVENKVPTFLEKQLKVILGKTTTQFAFPIFLIFILTCVSSLLAAEFVSYPFFLLSSSLFFLHGFMHVGQAILLHRYIPALITSVLVVIPYGTVLFWKLAITGIVSVPELLIYFLVAIVLAAPFIIGMHLVGEYVYKIVANVLIS